MFNMGTLLTLFSQHIKIDLQLSFSKHNFSGNSQDLSILNYFLLIELQMCAEHFSIGGNLRKPGWNNSKQGKPSETAVEWIVAEIFKDIKNNKTLEKANQH